MKEDEDKDNKVVFRRFLIMIIINLVLNINVLFIKWELAQLF